MAVFSLISAISRIRPWQEGQVSTSMPIVLRSNSAHELRRVCGIGAASLSCSIESNSSASASTPPTDVSAEGASGLAGSNARKSGRLFAFGANTPWNRIRFSHGGGISNASFFTNASGSMNRLL